MYNPFGVGREPQIYKFGLAMEVKIVGGAAKSGKNTHLLVVICVRLFHKIGLLNLTNRN